QPRVKQRERRAGDELAVGDAGAVRVVVEAQPHCRVRAHVIALTGWDIVGGAVWLQPAPRLELSALERARTTSVDPHARGRRAPGSAGAGAGGARALAPAGRVRGVPARARARPAVGLLRGATDCQR